MARATTNKQGLAYAFGKHRYKSPSGSVDLQQLAHRNQKDVELKAQGLDICINCWEGYRMNYEDPDDACPHCGYETLPF